MDVRGVKGPYNPTDLPAWARAQLEIASSIVDNPGGGLLFATQAIGQVKAALQEHGEEHYAEVVETLDRAEDSAIKREFEAATKLIGEAIARLS
ncbi:MAG: hypothetical protein ABI838_01835 [Chloroflexota bacterium]